MPDFTHSSEVIQSMMGSADGLRRASRKLFMVVNHPTNDDIPDDLKQALLEFSQAVTGVAEKLETAGLRVLTALDAATQPPTSSS